MLNISEKRRGQLFIQIGILAIILVAFGLLLISCGNSKERTTSDRVITYLVEGTANTGTITYTKADGTSIDPKNVSIPWRLSIKFSKTTTVILTATNPTQSGSIKCVILLDGEEWVQEASDAPGDRVSCAGRVTP